MSPRKRISDRKGNIVRRYQDQRAHQIRIMSDPKKLICLVSLGCHDRTQSSNQEKALSWFASRKTVMSTSQNPGLLMTVVVVLTIWSEPVLKSHAVCKISGKELPSAD